MEISPHYATSLSCAGQQMSASHSEFQQGEQLHPLRRILGRATEAHDHIVELAIDHPKRMFDLGPYLHLGFFDLVLGLVQGTAFARLLAGAQACRHLPNDHSARVLEALLAPGLPRISTADTRRLAVLSTAVDPLAAEESPSALLARLAYRTASGLLQNAQWLLGLFPGTRCHPSGGDGQGMVLGQSSMIADELAGGCLIMLFPLALPLPTSHFLIASNSAFDEKDCRDFHR